jgi:hypothetical protein
MDLGEYVKAARAAKLSTYSVIRVHQLRAAGALAAVRSDLGWLFLKADCLKLRRNRERRRALPTRRGARG